MSDLSSTTPAPANTPAPVQVPAETLSAAGVLGWASRAVAELSARRAEINALNVFPVPDADTGSNMTHTMEAALNEARKLDPDATVVRITEALAVGSVRGARGNSGVVLSQVLRAIAQAAADGVIDGHTIQKSLSIARSLVDRAITDPVEGTVVTVLRASAIAAEQAAEEGYVSLGDVVNHAVWAARTALARTPSQLEVLREAGVVDAGGQGLVILLESLQQQITGAPSPAGGLDAGTQTGTRSPEGESRPITIDHDSHGRVGDLEVMFYLTCAQAEDFDGLQQEIAGLGDSLLIAPVLKPLSRSRVRQVYLPKGVWFDYFTKERFESTGMWIRREVDLKTMPIYVKEGTVLRYCAADTHLQRGMGEIVKTEHWV